MIKVLYLILFCLIYSLTDIVLVVIALVQTVLKLSTGEPSESLKDAGRTLGLYLKQISEFLSYASEVKPYPFSDWPQAKAKDKLLDEIK
ncbi:MULTISPECIES: DUF4389 domain-containing protein [unclassified Oleiphilus]|uniref:DUF4389 domain-containing protein n=3 Tax=Oleiphilus TaxID=141450 RepID=UPI0007C24A0E|nr:MULTISPECIES: DUF4389 domain-containing protein [unclassified Oleiphilus]KZY46268.1 hypothetical protein A3732_07775 [Oleiphilus sp. HI0050]KZY77015.1 hypothetical protein A3741_10370 [Oleiphilus sp. HI0069]KZY83986.1 hypothetical protein A3740_04855 [Oleiphilus sp. HI0068]KZY88302.1 hypothetical protein A3743_12090 [Oleiphilus sp. HI0072]KZZ17258.1 hypothetical protein A3749_04230 [Oleiphilus sp. HI0078]KZZ28133.1 hypothetical protein A3752_04105 [Oleiphilus sp. HI0081]KZZ46418.1 hypothe